MEESFCKIQGKRDKEVQVELTKTNLIAFYELNHAQMEIEKRASWKRSVRESNIRHYTAFVKDMVDQMAEFFF